MHQRLLLVRAAKNASGQIRPGRPGLLREAVQGGAQDQGENDGGGQHAGRLPAAEKPTKFLPHGGDKRPGGEKGHGEGGGNHRETRK